MEILFYGKMMRVTNEEDAGDGWVVDPGMMPLSEGTFWRRDCAQWMQYNSDAEYLSHRLTNRAHYYLRSK